jgi:hypothetical protein
MGIPGSQLSVCVTPNEKAQNEGLGLASLDSFTWIREDVQNGGRVEQVAIENGAPYGNGLTTMQCDFNLCQFQSILKADFFVQAGNIPTEMPSSMPTSMPTASRMGFPRDGFYQNLNSLNFVGDGECTGDRIGGTYSWYAFEGTQYYNSDRCEYECGLLAYNFGFRDLLVGYMLEPGDVDKRCKCLLSNDSAELMPSGACSDYDDVDSCDFTQTGTGKVIGTKPSTRNNGQSCYAW